MSADVLDKARRVLVLAEKATPGPWRMGDAGSVMSDAGPVLFACTIGDDPEPGVSWFTNDSGFVIESRTLAPDLAAFVVLVEQVLREEIASGLSPSGSERIHDEFGDALNIAYRTALVIVRRRLGLPTTEER